MNNSVSPDDDSFTTMERRDEIIKILHNKGKVRVSYLSNILRVSEVTIRNDLKKLESSGELIRAHGYALTSNKETSTELPIEKKEFENKGLKRDIAGLAASIIQNGEAIILDSGSTTERLAEELEDVPLTVLTNGLNIAMRLSKNENTNIIVNGGRLRKKALSFSDGFQESQMMTYRFDKYFLGVDGLDINAGVTTFDESEARINRLFCSISDKIIIVCDSSKFGIRKHNVICPIKNIDTIITDSGVPNEYIHMCNKFGIKLLVSKED
ncbi:transcriptional repressor AgaR [Vibrio barjaei]|uniref:transcriptional repressor AgaR n=1 Tax=Vibrio barjaei TaxID=1676683 RepID=UPI00228330BA|nr:transcriptional repressor AgaR [Vibrio barjaei]MCY9873750.1 transcriptional repressor AgaR [Vibrio barjaei]